MLAVQIKIRTSSLLMILGGVDEAEVDLLLAVDDLIDAEVLLVGFEIGDSLLEVGVVLEEDEGDVVGCNEGAIDADF